MMTCPPDCPHWSRGRLFGLALRKHVLELLSRVFAHPWSDMRINVGGDPDVAVSQAFAHDLQVDSGLYVLLTR